MTTDLRPWLEAAVYCFFLAGLWAGFKEMSERGRRRAAAERDEMNDDGYRFNPARLIGRTAGAWIFVMAALAAMSHFRLTDLPPLF